MHLLYFAIPLAVLGIVLLVVGGPLGLIPLALAAGLFLYRTFAGTRTRSDAPLPAGEDGPGPGVGYAHRGQRQLGER